MLAPSQEQFTSVCVLENFFEGQQLTSALRRARIPSMVRSYHDTPMAGIYQAQKGFGELCVPVSRAVESESILDRARQEIRSTTEEELTSQAMSSETVPENEHRLGNSVFILGQIVLMVMFVLALSTMFSLPIWGGALLATMGAVALLLWRVVSPERKPVRLPRWHRRAR